MKRNRKNAMKLALGVICALFVGLFLVPRGTIIRAQERHLRVPLSTDWSHRHMIYSAPRSLMQSFQLQSEPRYIQQYYRRNAGGGRGEMRWQNPFHNRRGENEMTRDWAMNLGSGSDGATTVSVGAGEYAAKFSFDVTTAVTAADCTTDFVVYNTGATGSTAAKATGTVTIGTATGTTNLPTANDTIGTAGTGGSVTYEFETSVGSCSGLDRCVMIGASNAATAANLNTAIAGTCFNTCPGGNGHNDPNFTSAVNGVNNRELNLTAVTTGAAGNLTTFNSSSFNRERLAGMTDGTNSQASIVAYDHLYDTTCGGSTPSIHWAYNLSGANTINSSVVLSEDGTQVAFVQSPGFGNAVLSILKPHAGDGSSYDGVTVAAATPTTTTGTASTFVTCRAIAADSCLLNLTFHNTGFPFNSDSNSAPFYDYNNDVLYVGDDLGQVHKFINVFKGTPSEQTTGGWPATTDTTTANVLTAPIYDGTSGFVFVADARTSNSGSGSTHGGRVYAISSAGTVTASNQLAFSNGFTDAPIVDGSAGRLYVFASQDIGGTAAGVFQFTINTITGISSGTSGTETIVGAGNGTTPLFAGDFDNLYYNSEPNNTGDTPTGHLYVCGHPGGSPILYEIPITADAMGAAIMGPDLSSSSGATCSPVTAANTGTDGIIFVSVTNGSLTADSCTGGGGCVMSFVLGATGTIAATATNGLAETGGTSGIIIDNLSTTTGAAQVYFTQLTNRACTTGAATSGCAIQASQSGLN